jgi:hypothetical protein
LLEFIHCSSTANNSKQYCTTIGVLTLLTIGVVVGSGGGVGGRVGGGGGPRVGKSPGPIGGIAGSGGSGGGGGGGGGLGVLLQGYCRNFTAGIDKYIKVYKMCERLDEFECKNSKEKRGKWRKKEKAAKCYAFRSSAFLSSAFLAYLSFTKWLNWHVHSAYHYRILPTMILPKTLSIRSLAVYKSISKQLALLPMLPLNWYPSSILLVVVVVVVVAEVVVVVVVEAVVEVQLVEVAEGLGATPEAEPRHLWVMNQYESIYCWSKKVTSLY